MSEATVQGIGVSELVARFGSPLYVYDSAALAERYLSLRKRLNPALEIFYSLKANPNISICTLLRGLGARAEVSSLAELVTAFRAGVAPDDIVMPGPGKSRAELAAALDAPVHAIICESFGELALIDELARTRGVRARVALRVNPGFSVKGARLTMGGRSRQFGIDESAVLAATDLVRAHPHVHLVGVHAYLGTRILNEEVVAENTRRILDLAERVSSALGFPLELVDVGGGLGVAYFAAEQDLDRERLAALMNAAVNPFAAAHPDTRLALELGRYLVGPAGTYVTQVRYVKESMGERYAVVDGGTNHHMAAVGIGSFAKRNFPIRLLSRPHDEPDGEWTIAGPLCTPNDILGQRVTMPRPRPGDLIGVDRSGAYGPTASPTRFLSHGYPAEVLVHEGRPLLIREREDTEDLLRGQHLYDLTPSAPDPVRR